MRVKNVSGRARQIETLAFDQIDVDVDEVVEVSDELGASLLDQPANWAAVDDAPAEEPAPDVEADPKTKRGAAGKAAQSDEEAG